MMKKVCLAVCVIMLAAAMAFADDDATDATNATTDDLQMKFSGEVKTGVLWQQQEEPGTTTVNRARLGNNDDAGNVERDGFPPPGRIRLDGELTKGNIGLKMRWEVYDYRNAISPGWAYVYAYGDFIDNQLRLSGGRLGQSPWSSGGPEIWQELDNRAGLRVEFKPTFLPGLNVGFVLNEHNTESTNTEQTLSGMLQESIIGLAYANEYFEIRGAFRLDTDEDSKLDNMGKTEGYDLIYRVEEKALRRVVDGLGIWANGYLTGIAAKNTNIINYVNWLYIQYNPGALDLQLRGGVDVGHEKYFIKVKPVIFYSLTDFLRLGFIFRYEKDFGESAPAKDAPYKTLAFQPVIRVTFDSMYVDLAYQYSKEYTAADRIRQINWVNLRFVYTF